MQDLQKPKPKSRFRGCLRIVGWIIGIFILLIIVAAIASPSKTPQPTNPAPANAPAPQPTDTSEPQPTDTLAPQPANMSASQPTDTSAPQPTDTPIPEPTDTPAPPPDPNRGIQFGQPIIFDNGGFQTASLLVTNTTDQVKSFTVKATYKSGDNILATASGAVNDILPGQTRAASLLSQDTLPAQFDTVRIDVDTMIVESSTTRGSTAASKLVFGTPAISGTGNFITLNVEVTNNDSDAHSFTVQTLALLDGKLVGVATGAVNDLAPGQTKTATLLAQGQFKGAQLQTAAETIIK